MNEHIVQSYIDNITQHYGVSEKEIFNKEITTKKGTEPRQLLFYLCHRKGIPIVIFKDILKNRNGCELHTSTISGSIKKMTERIEGDEDYEVLIKKLMKVSTYV